MATILNSAILDSAILHKTLTQSYSIWLKVIHSDSTWWWQPSWTLPSCIQPFAQKNFTHAFSLKLMIAAILNSAILDSAILHKKKTSLVHSDSTWWWQPSWILPCWIQTLPSWIQTPCYLLSDSLKNTLPLLWFWLKLIHLINLMMATILNSAILDSAILHKTLTQTSSIWLKLIYSDSTWWWQPSWILPSWFQTLHILDSNTLLSSLRFTQKHSSSTLNSDSN